MGKMFDMLQKVERERDRESRRVPPKTAPETLERERYHEPERVSPITVPDTAERERYRESKRVAPQTAPEDIGLDNRLVSFFKQSSIVAEQFRRLRTYVIKPGMENSPKTILVTSTMAQEGKSMIAVNLAITIAIDLNSNALIVDCDLRNPSLSRWFGFQEQKGLSNYLLGEAQLSELLVKTSVDKLTILPGGTVQDNPVELIGSKRMKSLIAELKTRYEDRYIILDSSPLLATTEPRVLGDAVDGIIFVIKSGDTPRESIQQALKLLDKKKIIGVVLNQMEFKTEALIRRYFGTNRYYDYRYSKVQSEPRSSGKFASGTRDMKTGSVRRRAKK